MFRPGPALAALGFVSSCLEISRGHLILPLAPSERPFCQGSASLALPLLGSSPHLQRPSSLGLSLASPTAIFRPGLLVLSFLFPEIESLPTHSFSYFSPNFLYTCLLSWRNAEDLGTRYSSEPALWVPTVLCAEAAPSPSPPCGLVSHVTLLGLP